jgi:hypothetical protein
MAMVFQARERSNSSFDGSILILKVAFSKDIYLLVSCESSCFFGICILAINHHIIVRFDLYLSCT